MTTSLISDAVRAAFPFTVDKLPLNGPDGLKTPHYGLFRSDTAACVGVAVRKGYEPHTTDDVVALVEAACSAFSGEARAHCSFIDGHYVAVEPSIEYRRSIFGTADNIWPRLWIRAGYDGRAFNAQLGYYRDACRNMAIIREVSGRAITANIRHTAHLRDRLSELQQTFARLAAGWDSVAETARAMDARQVNLADFLRHVYPLADNASDRTRNSAERRIETIVSRVVRERQVTGRPRLVGDDGAYLVSAWEAFNAVQGYVQHDSRRHGRPDYFTRAIVALDDAAVSRALDLAIAV
jgi:hypothetical protein